MLAHARPLALLLSVSVLTACAVDPDYKSPEIALPHRSLGQEAVTQRQVQNTGGGWDARHASSDHLYSDLSTTDRR